MPKTKLKPLAGESYHDWKKRRLKIWAENLTSKDKEKIRGLIGWLTLVLAEAKEGSRR